MTTTGYENHLWSRTAPLIIESTRIRDWLDAEAVWLLEQDQQELVALRAELEERLELDPPTNACEAGVCSHPYC